MRWQKFAFVAVFVAALALSSLLFAGETGGTSYKVLPPITQGNLTIFPVVAAATHDTAGFLTLDEGLRSGEVVVTEAGRVAGLIRRRGPWENQFRRDGAQVNQLVLVNSSKRPLLLLAGEIVTGGKQDRVIGKDRIVPAGGDPIDLSVFCVEPGRWTETNAGFKPSVAGGVGGFMAQPSLRKYAMAAKNQQQVWDEVKRSNEAAAAVAAPAGAGSAGTVLAGTTSYARVMGDKAVQDQVERIAAPISQNYTTVLRDLRDRNAVGVVVAVGGRIIWADVFANTNLLQRYWPKLVRSYATEALVRSVSKGGPVDIAAAGNFLQQMGGTHEVTDSEPGVYRHTEVTGSGFRVFQLTSLLPGTGFDVHLAKMAE
jgi:ARG/rhodanese/phosphatase superfamily protein